MLVVACMLSMVACSKPASEPAASPAESQEVKVEDLNTTQDTNVSQEVSDAAAADKPVNLKCGLTFKLDDYRGEDLVWWANRVKELSGGSINIELYPSETLVAGSESVSSMVMGSIDMYLIAPSYVEGVVEGMAGLTMPCTAGIEKLEERLQLCYDIMVALQDKLTATFDKAGIKFIGTLCQGGYVDMVFNKPIRSAEEYTQFKVRTTGGISDEMLKALGCTPVFISSSDLYMSLQTGVVDGAMTTPTTILSNKLYELCPYMVVPSLSNNYSPYFICSSNEAWDSMSANQQEILVKAAYECLARTIEIYPERQSADREKVIAELEEYIVLPDEEWAKMQEKFAPVYESYAAEFGPVDKEIYEIKTAMEKDWDAKKNQ